MEPTPSELPEKKEKRINALIKSSRSMLLLAAILFCLAPLGMVLMVVCFMYYVETGLLLKKYGKDMKRSLKNQLKGARSRYLFMGLFLLILYVGAIVAFLLSGP